MKALKKGIALIVSLVMALGMTVNAFATVDSITYSGAEVADYVVNSFSEDYGLADAVSDVGTFMSDEGNSGYTSADIAISGTETLDSTLTLDTDIDNDGTSDYSLTISGTDDAEGNNAVIEAASTEGTRTIDPETGVNTGDSNTFSDTAGGVIATHGNVTLTDVTVDANGEARAVLLADGTLTLEAGTKITEGNRSGSGGGIMVVGPGQSTEGTLILKEGSKVSGNNASNYGGGIMSYKTVIMDGGIVSDNQAGKGFGGIGIQGSSKESDPNAGKLIMNGGTVSNNSAGTIGGGVGSPWGTTIINGGTIENNVSNNSGSGLVVDGPTTINGGVIGGTIIVGSDETYGSASLGITGGTFSEDVSGYLTDEGDMILIYNATENSYTVQDKDYTETGFLTVKQVENDDGSKVYVLAPDPDYVPPETPAVITTPVESDDFIPDYDWSEGMTATEPATTIADEETPLAALPEGFGLTLDDAIEIAAEYEIVAEDAETVSREEFILTLYKIAEDSGYAVDARADITAFLDEADVSKSCYEAIQWAVANGIIGGSEGKLLALGTLTQEQLDLIMARFAAFVAANAEA